MLTWDGFSDDSTNNISQNWTHFSHLSYNMVQRITKAMQITMATLFRSWRFIVMFNLNDYHEGKLSPSFNHITSFRGNKDHPQLCFVNFKKERKKSLVFWKNCNGNSPSVIILFCPKEKLRYEGIFLIWALYPVRYPLTLLPW